MTRTARVHRVPMPDPGDCGALAALIDAGTIDPARIVAVMGKTPGNGLTNDHTREFATVTVAGELARRLGVAPAEVRARVLFVLSGGTEGMNAPHLLVFCAGPSAAAEGDERALALATAASVPLAPEAIGRAAQIAATADAVRAAMAEAGITDPADVAFVQVKCPIPMPGDFHDPARAAGLSAASIGTIKGRSRAASALGVAVALGDVGVEDATEAAIAARPDLFTGRACVTAGIDDDRASVLVLGNARGWSGPQSVGSTTMRDPLDAPAVAALLRRLGMTLAGGQAEPAGPLRLAGLIVKGEPPATDRLRGAQHVMLDDSDIHPVRHYRAFMSGVLGAVTGDTHVYLSGGAEHQGPPGGAVVAAIVERQ
ncbi:ring-opening amidohydrolase [Azospirillum sp. RWY-5-1]|uniref:Cyclic amide hydrolase n=1 Tax=Azospirillum oleiclasticum TaxID=2735135 RepID=A0ABX2TED7_9PROT|nr:ring-opening amidohydrolase [Azospirillum oleiclasticum]NYZ15523.1 ring-opening amidohydrolase [Azospirillum oleiclasticum]NYZ22546.1 ring-opening amidohydrolase [Azospirillum oleiclasticum]